MLTKEQIKVGVRVRDDRGIYNEGTITYFGDDERYFTIQWDLNSDIFTYDIVWHYTNFTIIGSNDSDFEQRMKHAMKYL